MADRIGMSLITYFNAWVIVLDEGSCISLREILSRVKVTVLPNFLPAPTAVSGIGGERLYRSLQPFALYLGRIADGKGIEDLLAAWDSVEAEDGIAVGLVDTGFVTQAAA